MSRERGTKKSRFSLWLPDETLTEIARLQRVQGKEAAAEVVRDALNVYLELLRARDSGIELFFADASSGTKGRVWILPGRLPGQKI